MQAGASSGLPTLTKVGEFTPTKTGTANPLGTFGNALVTGAASAPDGTRVVIRTISDAYEFTVGSDGDVVKAITEGTPVITPLPNEENGQAISYSADGKSFLTMGSVEKPVLRSYKPHVPPAPTSIAEAPAAAEGSAGLRFADITNIAAAVGVAGFLAVVAGVIGIYRARRQFRERGEWSEDDEGYDDYARPGRRDGRGGRDRSRRGERGERDWRDERDGDGRGRPTQPDRRGEGERRPYGDDEQEQASRSRPRQGRAEVRGQANVNIDSGRGPHGPGPSYVPPPVHPQAPPPSQPQPTPPGPPSGPATGRATPPRPRPASGGRSTADPARNPTAATTRGVAATATTTSTIDAPDRSVRCRRHGAGIVGGRGPCVARYQCRPVTSARCLSASARLLLART